MDFEEVEGHRKNSKLFKSQNGFYYLKNKATKNDENLIHIRYSYTYYKYSILLSRLDLGVCILGKL